MLLDVPQWGSYQLLGQTRDDAAGEAFDKVGALLGLDYPAGAAIEQLARDGDPARFVFPRPLLRSGDADFSFSGLKTAVLRAVQQSGNLAADRAAIARGFQDAAIDVLVAKTAHAAEEHGRELVVLGGGVACNRALAERMRDALAPRVRVAVASPRLNTDNAAMIAAAGSWRLTEGQRDDYSLEAYDALPLPGMHRP
jgi:N6-L-threonylcarbamoyladenine synthase